MLYSISVVFSIIVAGCNIVILFDFSVRFSKWISHLTSPIKPLPLILRVDDINTSGSTLREPLRIINEINSNCNIYIYTLIGKN